VGNQRAFEILTVDTVIPANRALALGITHKVVTFDALAYEANFLATSVVFRESINLLSKTLVKESTLASVFALESKYLKNRYNQKLHSNL